MGTRGVGPRIVRDLERKIVSLPGAGDGITLGVGARERVRDLPVGVRAMTAADIFG